MKAARSADDGQAFVIAQLRKGQGARGKAETLLKLPGDQPFCRPIGLDRSRAAALRRAYLATAPEL